MTVGSAPIVYRSDGSSFLVIVSADTDHVVSAYLEHDACSDWHFGYNAREQEAIEKLIPSCTYARIVVWDQPVDPESEWYPVEDLQFVINGAIGYALCTMTAGEEKGGVGYRHLLTVDRRVTNVSPVRLRADLFSASPELPAASVWGAAIEYLHTGELPAGVDWQERYSRVPRGPFGRQLVSDDELPPEIEFIPVRH